MVLNQVSKAFHASKSPLNPESKPNLLSMTFVDQLYTFEFFFLVKLNFKLLEAYKTSWELM